MKKILWVSQFVPYDTVPHAGGKTENYYIKKLNSTGKFNIQMFTFAGYDELEKIDLRSYGISYKVSPYERNIVKHAFWSALYRIRKWNPFGKYGSFVTPFCEYKVKTGMRKLKREGYAPDVVILQWTQMVLYTDFIKNVFLETPIISIEEDVAFLSYQRRYEMEKGAVVRSIKKKQFEHLKLMEEECLRKSDLVIFSNHKDYKLIEKDSITDNAWVWVPYFQNLKSCKYQGKCSKDILFYGAMDRYENWKSALWFIDNVLPELGDMRVVIVGNKPNKKLMERSSDQVYITGYVDDIRPYFENSLCMVAPLVLGAGIKVKVLEALSAGLPVLTNHIGIEGIEAVDGESYLHCETAEDYVNAINALANRRVDADMISCRSKKFMEDTYDIEKSAQEFLKRVESICQQNNSEGGKHGSK